ncbi:MAG TPA: CaiB/BaiF CoA-transferase family protein [Eoetvoesiella sp.]
MRVLDGIRVLELGRVPPAELPGMMLADLGADVLKIETPRRGEPLSQQEQRSAVYAHTNRNKRSIELDLKTLKGQEIFQMLASKADVLIEGFRPGVMARLGASYDKIKQLNPNIIYCSLSGFGQTGPYSDRPAHDLNFLALSGALSLIGEVGCKPSIPLNMVADYGGASMHGALAIAFALFARERTGKGRYLDIAYLDSTIALLAATPNLRGVFTRDESPQRGEGVFSGTYPYYAIYQTRDNRLLTVACSEPVFWENFCQAIGRPDLSRHARRLEHYQRTANLEETHARKEVEAMIRMRDLDDWDCYFASLDVCVGKVNNIKEMLVDPQVIHRGMITEATHERFGKVQQFESALPLSSAHTHVYKPSPIPGEHSSQILSELGFSKEEIQSLKDQKVIM